jgi:hypothetical protein
MKLQKHLRGHNCQALCMAEQQSGDGSNWVEFPTLKDAHSPITAELLMYTDQQLMLVDTQAAVC